MWWGIGIIVVLLVAARILWVLDKYGADPTDWLGY